MGEIIKDSDPRFVVTEEMVLADPENMELKDQYWEERVAASKMYGPQWATANFSTDGKVDIRGRLNSRGNRNRLTSTPFENFETAKNVLAKYFGASD